MKKKAQAGMFEIIVVLFVFFLLIGFGLIFYAGMQKRSSTEDSKRVLELRAVRVAQIASTLPELQCSLDNAVRENCIEVEKAMAAKDVIEKNIADYSDMFGYGKISIKGIYPDSSLSMLLYDFNPSRQTYDTTAIQIPISLYDSVKKQNYFGVLNVEVYS